jgi:hypothetical protein
MHNFNISLADYQKASCSEIASAMLDRVLATELIESTVEKNIAPFLKRHSMELDNFLCDYSLEVMNAGLLN